jgi:hypothetical protein
MHRYDPVTVAPNQGGDVMKLCPNCGGDQSSWEIQARPGDYSGAIITAVLGCDECSETLSVVDEDEVNRMLNFRENLARCYERAASQKTINIGQEFRAWEFAQQAGFIRAFESKG